MSELKERIEINEKIVWVEGDSLKIKTEKMENKKFYFVNYKGKEYFIMKFGDEIGIYECEIGFRPSFVFVMMVIITIMVMFLLFKIYQKM